MTDSHKPTESAATTAIPTKIGNVKNSQPEMFGLRAIIPSRIINAIAKSSTPEITDDSGISNRGK